MDLLSLTDLLGSDLLSTSTVVVCISLGCEIKTEDASSFPSSLLEENPKVSKSIKNPCTLKLFKERTERSKNKYGALFNLAIELTPEEIRSD